MSTKTKKTSKVASTGIRYPDSLKKEVVSFVTKHNAEIGRGGQSAAVKKYKVTPLTIAAWLKAAGVKGPGRSAKKKSAAKPAKPSKAGASKKGVRYPQSFKQEVVDFVNSYNANKGRGGQNQAAKKFKLSVLTVSAWLKASGTKAPVKASKKAAVKVAKKAAKSGAAKPASNIREVVALLQAALNKLKA